METATPTKDKPISKIAEMLGREQPSNIKVVNGVTVWAIGKLNTKKFVKKALTL
ncbi:MULTISPECIES: hypothetical protein [unclassified Exiguobacterium]|uniref:hypothetical protein n=1 Tax=unclassified Exiguobacterium TaxID=2644629 RepID=UPI0013F3DDB1|nr:MULTISPECIES: hypothetical protein [unclassified Exiguobacterium]